MVCLFLSPLHHTHNVQPILISVLKTPLEQHGSTPVTGFFRDNFCRPSSQDPAAHTLAGIVTKEFLEFSKAQGNDLQTPRPGFEGLAAGCRWCLCVSRYVPSPYIFLSFSFQDPSKATKKRKVSDVLGSGRSVRSRYVDGRKRSSRPRTILMESGSCRG